MKFLSAIKGVLTAGLLTALPTQADEEPCNDVPAYVKPDQKISPDLCAILKNKAASDFLGITITLKKSDNPPADTTDPKKDSSGGQSTKDPDSAASRELAESTRLLFTTYDLRDISGPDRRLSVPEKIEGTYLVMATKASIYQVSMEGYILGIAAWDARPVMGIPPRSLKSHGPRGDRGFNLKGQRLTNFLSNNNIDLIGIFR